MAGPAQAKVLFDAMKQEVGKCYGQLMTGYQKGDFKVTSQIYGPNCTILAPGRPIIKGREGAEKYWKDLKEETGVTKIEIKCEEMNGVGDWWFERGSYKLYKKDQPFEERKYLKVWRKWEGKFYIYSYCFNIVPLAK